MTTAYSLYRIFASNYAPLYRIVLFLPMLFSPVYYLIPFFNPGAQHGYHLLTFGLYINEIIMRIDPQHRTLDQFFLEEIAEPLGEYLI